MPDIRKVDNGDTTTFTIMPESGYSIASVTGCGGTLTGTTYTTAAITSNCEVTATFGLPFTIGGTISGLNDGVSIVLRNNGGDDLQVYTNGDFTFHTSLIDSNTYDVTIATQPDSQACTVTNGAGTVNGANVTTIVVGNCVLAPPPAPTVSLNYDMKESQFSWNDVTGATYYNLRENPDGVSGYNNIASNLVVTQFNHNIAVHHRINARYQVEACNDAGCTGSDEILMTERLVPAIGYFKASNTDANDAFGWSLAISGDGNTLVIGAVEEDSAATGIDGLESDNSSTNSGAVYVFTRSGTTWIKEAYIKASNADAYDQFGYSVALADDGNTLAIGAYGEDGGDILDENNNTSGDSGSVYIYTRSAAGWTKVAYLKASTIGDGDRFGNSVSLSDDGNTLAVGSYNQDSGSTGINGIENDGTAPNSGAVYLFTRSGTTWSQQAYIKASNTEAYDYFGYSVSLSGDGSTLAVGANREESATTGINGNQTDNSANDGGAVYVFAYDTTSWSQQAYIKASNTGAGDEFGYAVALSDNGNTLAVGALNEGGATTGINGDGSDGESGSGAAYVFSRSGTLWSQQAYIKASNTQSYDNFGWSVALSGSGDTLAVGAYREDGSTSGVNGDDTDNSALNGGAAFVFNRSSSEWSQGAYLKASNTGNGDFYGHAITLSDDSNTLAVGAIREDSAATGINGNTADDTTTYSGAVYLY